MASKGLLRLRRVCELEKEKEKEPVGEPEDRSDGRGVVVVVVVVVLLCGVVVGRGGEVHYGDGCQGWW